jgi:formylglycine-generating enzyme required for sulfatase activity
MTVWGGGGYEDLPSCEATVWVEISDCDDYEDAECAAGACVLEEGRCPQGSIGFCQDGVARGCHGDRLLAWSQDCESEGLTCFSVERPEGAMDGVCSIRDEPCRDQTRAYDLECQGDTFVECQDGYPTSEHACAQDERCLESDGFPECGLTLPCPVDGSNLCANDKVYSCEYSTTPTALRDCRETNGVCTTVAGQALCSLQPGGPAAPTFVPIAGGTFAMGPRESTHEETVDDFQLMDREVTLGAYAGCVQSGACPPPGTNGAYCSFSDLEFDADLPVTCIEQADADAFCRYVGGRLPLQSEWEFAMRGGGADVLHPWGDDTPTCDLAIMRGDGVIGCGREEPWPGCSRNADRTSAGICDLAGNVREWTANGVHGGSAESSAPFNLRTLSAYGQPGRFVGFRCAR